MYWTDLLKLGASTWANGVTLTETLLAANAVVGKRGQTIDAAMRDPLAADVEELATMVTEKIIAFGETASAITHDLMRMQQDMLAQNRDLVRLFVEGWPPDIATLDRVARRGSRLVLKMSVAGGRAMAPIHAAATANDQRLRRRASDGARR